MPGFISLAIIVVNWNTKELLRRCLQSIERACHNAPALRITTIVVDNASTDGSAKMVSSEFSAIHLISNQTNTGFAAANNQAIRASDADWVLLLNSDADISAQALQGLVNCGVQNLRAGVVGCKLVNPDGSFQAAGNAFPTVLTTVVEAWGLMGKLTRNPFYPSYPPWRAHQTQPCDWLGGACLLVRRTAIDAVGLLDETFFMNAEEMDWCYRMWRHGWQVWYVHDAEVLHVGGASADRRSARQRMRLYEGKVRFVRKHYGRWAGALVRLNFRFASLTKAVGYRLAYLLIRRQDLRLQAASHWPVTWNKRWV